MIGLLLVCLVFVLYVVAVCVIWRWAIRRELRLHLDSLRRLLR